LHPELELHVDQLFNGPPKAPRSARNGPHALL
jgi:hypothetical protein